MIANDLKLEFKTLTKLAAPIMFGQVSQMLFGLIDTVMIGHVGTTELAATAFANSVFIVFLVFGIGIANATSPLVSRAIGRTDHSGARRILTDALLVSGVVGIILTLLGLICLLAFDKMGQLPAVAAQAKVYFSLIIFTLVPAMLFQCYKQYLECIGHARIPMFSAFGGLTANVLLNFVLIFGFGSIPPLGIAGAAIGTLLARLGMLAYLSAYVRWEKTHRAPESKQARFEIPLRSVVVRDLLGIGIPTAFNLLFEVGAFATASIMVGWIGSVELAAHQVTLSLASLTFMVPLGLSFAASIRVGTELGRNDYLAAKRAGIASVTIAGMFMTMTAILLATGCYFWPRFFTKDPEVIKLAAPFILISAFFQLFDGVQVVCAGLLRALKDVRWPLAINLTAYWIIALPLGYLLSFTLNLGPTGIWWGLAGGLFVAAVSLSIRFFTLLASEQKANLR